MDLIGGKWKGLIIYHLFRGPQRYVALKALLPKISSRVLTLQLRELEADGLVIRTVYPDIPPRVEYTLTETGNALQPAFSKMNEWAEYYKSQQAI
jgi:DNA-binding HxlR family transcriptional regulator